VTHGSETKRFSETLPDFCGIPSAERYTLGRSILNCLDQRFVHFIMTDMPIANRLSLLRVEIVEWFVVIRERILLESFDDIEEIMTTERELPCGNPECVLFRIKRRDLDGFDFFLSIVLRHIVLVFELV